MNLHQTVLIVAVGIGVPTLIVLAAMAWNYLRPAERVEPKPPPRRYRAKE